MSNFHDIVLEAFKTEDTVLVEDKMIEENLVFPISPFLAFTAFKKKTFDQLRNSKAFKKFSKTKEDLNPKKVKASALIAKEKIKAKAEVGGSKEEYTTYKMTPEQVEVMADIYNKYGPELVKEINHFRENVLAPYQLIKRLIKKNKSLTSTDITGMNKDEFRSSLESGRKKIVRRGEFFEKSQALQNKLRDLEDVIKSLEGEKEKLKTGKDLSPSVLEKVYSEFDVGEKELGGFSLENLKVTYDEILKNYKSLSKYNEGKDTESSPADILSIVQKQKSLREKGSNKDEEGKNFSLALYKYMIRKSIRENFKRETGENIYKKTYIAIIDEMISDAKSRKQDVMAEFVTLRKSIDLNDKENKIWKKLPTTLSDYSGDIEKYYQKYREEDYEAPKYYDRPDELVKAEQEIENEIKRFERKLATIVSAEDLAQLKKYRLINNLITVSELKDPENLFKTQAELSADKAKKQAATPYMDENTYYRRLKELATMEFDTIEEMNNAKTTAKELAQGMRDQGDGDVVQKYADLLRQITTRRSPEARKLVGHNYEFNETLTINDVEDFAKDLIKKRYDSVDQIKQDKMLLDKMIEKYKKEEPEAERNLKEISFVLDQVNRKLAGELGNYLDSEK